MLRCADCRTVGDDLNGCTCTRCNCMECTYGYSQLPFCSFVLHMLHGISRWCNSLVGPHKPNTADQNGICTLGTLQRHTNITLCSIATNSCLPAQVCPISVFFAQHWWSYILWGARHTCCLSARCVWAVAVAFAFLFIAIGWLPQVQHTFRMSIGGAYISCPDLLPCHCFAAYSLQTRQVDKARHHFHHSWRNLT